VQSTSAEIVDLRRLSARELESLLVEETAAWRETLDWEFEKSADLVRRFVDMHALNGRALVEDGEVVGYLYYVLEDNKGLLGDLYVRRGRRTVEHENRLMEAVLAEIMEGPGITRIESQLLMMEYGMDRVVPRADCATTFERNFMQVDLNRALLGAGTVRKPVRIERWNDQWNDMAAHLIAAAYEGHVDSRINDQYQSVAGARRFLFNIVQYPGCGVFHRPASFAAFEPQSGSLCGISLASLVAPDCGHITQICVSPATRGTGVGHELMRQSLTALRGMGCRSASLTVTAANAGAVSLYERMGFHTARKFFAFVWEGY
jgi:ribosomal protein S18 acetylase RimI-like enzyme